MSSRSSARSEPSCSCRWTCATSGRWRPFSQQFGKSGAISISSSTRSPLLLRQAQSAATSRVFAVRYRERVDEDADILGLAAANAAAAVSGTFVVNGSPTQTAMADRTGARSQVAQLVFAGVVLLVLL